MWTRFPLLLSFCVTACAQILEMTPAAVDQGSANIFRIILKPGAEKPLAALQWDLVYRNGLRIEATGVVTGAASEQAGKSVTCAARPPEGANYRLVCILAGGVKEIPAGPIAIVRFEAGSDAPKGEMLVSLEKGSGVTPGLESVPVGSTKTSIHIR
jgi:hypothetical protein